MDISSINEKSFGGARFWALLIDEFTNRTWSIFLKAKSDLKDKVIPWIRSIKRDHGVTIQIIRCDNAGENKALQQAIDKTEDLRIKFEYTAPDTPEQNGVVERKFQTLYGKVRSALNGARLPTELRSGLWAECAETMTKLENLLVDQGGNHALMKGLMVLSQNSPKF